MISYRLISKAKLSVLYWTWQFSIRKILNEIEHWFVSLYEILESKSAHWLWVQKTWSRLFYGPYCSSFLRLSKNWIHKQQKCLMYTSDVHINGIVHNDWKKQRKITTRHQRCICEWFTIEKENKILQFLFSLTSDSIIQSLVLIPAKWNAAGKKIKKMKTCHDGYVWIRKFILSISKI